MEIASLALTGLPRPHPFAMERGAEALEVRRWGPWCSKCQPLCVSACFVIQLCSPFENGVPSFFWSMSHLQLTLWPRFTESASSSGRCNFCFVTNSICLGHPSRKGTLNNSTLSDNFHGVYFCILHFRCPVHACRHRSDSSSNPRSVT